MKKTFSKVAIVVFTILFLSSAAFALNKPTEYSSKGVTPKNHKKLPIDKIILEWPKMKKAKSYAIHVQRIDLNDITLSEELLILTNKNKIDIINDNFQSIREPSQEPIFLLNKKDVIDFFQKGYKYGWGVAGLDSNITLEPKYETEEDLTKTLETLLPVGQFKKPLYFFTEPKAFLGAVLTLVSDELLAETPEIIKEQLQSGEGEAIIYFIGNSPAAKAGLQEGDIILEIDGKQINKNFRVTDSVELKNPGDVINVKIWRAEQITSKIFYKKIKLTKRPYKNPIY